MKNDIPLYISHFCFLHQKIERWSLDALWLSLKFPATFLLAVLQYSSAWLPALSHAIFYTDHSVSACSHPLAHYLSACGLLLWLPLHFLANSLTLGQIH